MKTSTIIWILVALAVVFGGWYLLSAKQGAYSYTPTDQTQTSTGNTQATASTTPGNGGNLVLSINTDPKLGQYLVATNGMTLYQSSADKSGVSNCKGVCASNWPAYTVTTSTTLPVETSLLGKIGTLALADGRFQVTYKGMPLYFWKKDTQPGDVTGNGVKTFTIVHP